MEQMFLPLRGCTQEAIVRPWVENHKSELSLLFRYVSENS
jgi:hypothetical protein